MNHRGETDLAVRSGPPNSVFSAPGRDQERNRNLELERFDVADRTRSRPGGEKTVPDADVVVLVGQVGVVNCSGGGEAGGGARVPVKTGNRPFNININISTER